MLVRIETKRCDIAIRIDCSTSRPNGPSKLSIHKNIDFKLWKRVYRVIVPRDRVASLRVAFCVDSSVRSHIVLVAFKTWVGRQVLPRSSISSIYTLTYFCYKCLYKYIIFVYMYEYQCQSYPSKINPHTHFNNLCDTVIQKLININI